MLTLYIICALTGGILVLVTLVGGFGEHDFGHDVGGDADVGHDMHDLAHDAAHHVGGFTAGISLFTFFASFRFWLYSILGFGAIGWLLTATSTIPSLIVCLIAIASGFVTGTAMVMVFRMIVASDTDSSIQYKDMLGADGKVIVTIRHNEPGRIQCHIRGEIVDFLAISDETEPLAPGEEVIVVNIENDRARVIKRATLLEG